MKELQQYGEVKLVRRVDGWYVEITVEGGVHSAGPTTEERARKVWREVEAAARRAAR